MDLHPDQFGAMHSKLQTSGGFTYNPRQQRFHEEGFVVSTYPEHEERTSTATSSPATIESYAGAKAAPLADKPNMLGGWRSEPKTGPHEDVLDVVKAYPRTGAGESASRYQAVKHTQEATYELKGAGVEGEEHPNPFHPKGSQFPEFAALASSGISMAQVYKKAPEIKAWVQGPASRERHGQGP